VDLLYSDHIASCTAASSKTHSTVSGAMQDAILLRARILQPFRVV